MFEGIGNYKSFFKLGSAGGAIAGAAAGTGTTAGSGYSLGNAADTVTKSSEGGHLTPGWLMAIGAFSALSGLT